MVPMFLRLDAHCVVLADLHAIFNAGSAMPMSKVMMLMTTSNSMSVNPAGCLIAFMLRDLFLKLAIE